MYHTGGIIGTDAVPRHRGVMQADEVPAVLKRGEGVFTPGQKRAMGGPQVNIVINEAPGTKANVT